MSTFPDRGARGAAALRFVLPAALAVACGAPPPATTTPVPAPAPATPAAPAPRPSPLDGATLLARGPFSAYRQGASTLLVVPASAIGAPLLWYAEVVGVPAGMTANFGLELGQSLVRLERRADRIDVRDLTTALQRRNAAAEAPSSTPVRPAHGVTSEVAPRAIDVALGALETGAIIASLPLRGVTDAGDLVVDATGTFSADIPTLPARIFLLLGGVQPVAADPSRSYVERVRAGARSLNIRSHLTYVTSTGEAASIVVGHSLVQLPERPMRGRVADPRVGYFDTRFVQYEGEGSAVVQPRAFISRHRLEKANPAAAVSDPVRPITYWLGPGIPERWRRYVREGILSWNPVFEAAGISNAIRVEEAPAPAQDPAWAVEDVTMNIVRWVPEERANAMGPRAVDPRSGEILGAHILIWPSVIDFIGQYYWAFFGGGTDPEATRLPLSTEKSGAILRYIVAHEVGHTLGLLHNQLASTTRTTAQLRDPAIANRLGPNTSIMAYGRFNQAAQPGDGITQLWSVHGDYDRAAIRYGYGSFGTDSASEAAALAAFAATFSRDRGLFFGSTELPELRRRFERDPRVQVENVGADRIEATRLGLANLRRSLDRLEAAAGHDEALFASTYDMLLQRQVTLTRSVLSLVGGTMPRLEADGGPPVAYVPAAEQRAAVRYLLTEAVPAFEPFQQPRFVDRIAPVGGHRTIERIQSSYVVALLTGPTIALLESRHARDASHYSSLDLGRDVTAAVWGSLGATTPASRAQQRGYLDAARQLLTAWAARGTTLVGVPMTLASTGADAPDVVLEKSSLGDDTLFPAWLRGTLATLQPSLEAAARRARTPEDRVHYQAMATEVARLRRIGAP